MQIMTKHKRVRGQALVLAALALELCGALPALAAPIDITVQPLALGGENGSRVDGLQFLSAVALSSSDARFGGYSGLWFSPDGRRMTAVSDTGLRLSTVVARDGAGAIAGLSAADLAAIAGPDGRPLRGNKGARDAEALSVAADGSHYVAYEIDHRIARHEAGDDALRKPGALLALPAMARRMPANGGFEALAALSGGRLLALSEKHRDRDGYAVGWLFAPERIGRWRYQVDGGFQPTDMALLPNGDLLVLERRLNWLSGFAIRLRRFPQSALRAPGPVLPREVADFDNVARIHNFEGLAVIPAPDGGKAVLVHLISDDNFSALQRTLLLVFRYAY